MEIANKHAPAITAADFERAAKTLNCDVAAIRAVWQVETRGSAYDREGRLAMLFEPHHFYRLLGPGPARDAAVAAGIAYPQWRKNYKEDPYVRFFKACEIGGEEIARQAASWGGPQIMGFNHELVGYDSAIEMCAAFLAAEAPQLDAFVKFVIGNKIDDELRAHDWAGFARRYNGPAYAENEYDTKLAEAHKFWKRKLAAEPAPKVEEPATAEPVEPASAPESPVAEELAAEPSLKAIVADWLAKQEAANAALDLVKAEIAK